MMRFLCAVVGFCALGVAKKTAYKPTELITYCVDVELDPSNKEDYEKCKLALKDCQNNMEVHRLLEKGHDPNIELDQSGRSLIIQATFAGQKDIVAELLNYGATKGADVNKQAKSGHTALIYAAAKGNTDLVKLFLAAGAGEGVNLQIRDGKKIGYTALHFAAEGGHVKIAQALFDAGANPGLKDSAGKTAQDVAKGQHPTTQTELEVRSEAHNHTSNPFANHTTGDLFQFRGHGRS